MKTMTMIEPRTDLRGFLFLALLVALLIVLA